MNSINVFNSPAEESEKPKSRRRHDVAGHDDIHKLLIDSLNTPGVKKNRQRDSYRHSASTSTSRERHSRSSTKQPSNSTSNISSTENSRDVTAEPQPRPVLPMTRSSPAVPSTSQSLQTQTLPESDSITVMNGRCSPPPAYDMTDWDLMVSRINTNPDSATYEVL